MENKVKVSVCMITYGHEKYILQAIEGVLMQKCDFDVELILANDCSPDSTHTVIQDILKNHPRSSWIKYFNHQENLGMIPNFIFSLKECKGKYIALCEGDDYWIDPLKLQRQVDFLEANADYVIHSGNAKLIKNNIVTSELMVTSNENKSFNISDFYKQNNLITCTVMFRNCMNFSVVKFNEVTFGDWFLYVLLMKESGLKAFRIKEILSVYRIHSSSVMTNLSLLKNYDAHLYQITELKKIIGYVKYPTTVLHAVNWYSVRKFKIEIKKYQFMSAFKTFIRNLRISKFKISIKQYLRVFLVIVANE